MYIFSGPSPRRDGDLDAEVILHEYTHGLSNRLYAACDGYVKLLPVGTESELLAQVKELPRQPGLQVGVCGGDGTLMRVMSCLNRVLGPDALPVLVPIPFGTVCTTCARWNAGRAPWRNLRAWLSHPALILNRQRTLSVTLDGTEHIGCTVGAGLVAQFFEHYESAEAPGVGTACKIAVKSFLGSFVSSPFSRSIMQPTECQLLVDEQTVPMRHFTLIVSSVFKNVGLGIQVTYRAGNDPERIALVSSSLPARQLGPQFWRVLTGRALRDPNGVDRQVKQWTMRFRGTSSIIIDGDRLTAHSVAVRPGPVWSVLTPAPHE